MLHKTEEHRTQQISIKKKKMQVILLTHSMKKTTWKYAIIKLKIASSGEKKMIHTSKDAQATAAICSYGQNPWKAQLREATLGLVAETHPKLCCSLWRQETVTTP